MTSLSGGGGGRNGYGEVRLDEALLDGGLDEEVEHRGGAGRVHGQVRQLGVRLAEAHLQLLLGEHLFGEEVVEEAADLELLLLGLVYNKENGALDELVVEVGHAQLAHAALRLAEVPADEELLQQRVDSLLQLVHGPPVPRPPNLLHAAVLVVAAQHALGHLHHVAAEVHHRGVDEEGRRQHLVHHGARQEGGHGTGRAWGVDLQVVHEFEHALEALQE